MSKKKNKTVDERLEAIQELGADLHQRRIYLFGDVTPDMSWKAITALDLLKRDGKPISVILNSGGGDEYEGWAIYDAFVPFRKYISVYAVGQAMSMAAILLQIGSRRLLAPNLRFMIHNGHGPDFKGAPHASVLKAWGKEQHINDKRYAAELAARSKLTFQEVEAMCEQETFMSAEEAVRDGFADQIYKGGTR